MLKWSLIWLRKKCHVSRTKGSELSYLIARSMFLCLCFPQAFIKVPFNVPPGSLDWRKIILTGQHPPLCGKETQNPLWLAWEGVKSWGYKFQLLIAFRSCFLYPQLWSVWSKGLSQRARGSQSLHIPKKLDLDWFLRGDLWVLGISCLIKVSV